MEEKKQFTHLHELGEFGLIQKITKDISLKQASSVIGIGDDAAVIDNGDKLTVISTDLLVEGVHFDLMYVPLKHLGYKAVVVNLSDIYAMNAAPRQITVSLALSSKFTLEAIEELYAGIKQACNYYGVDLIGGDTTSSLKGMTISVTAIGQAHKNKIVERSTAKKGDYICVSGNLGAAYLGLQILEREKQVYLENPNIIPSLDEYTYLVGRQLKPEARRDIVAVLNDIGVKPTSMIDISDGLSSELLHICHASDTGCVIEERDIPIHSEAVEQALKFSLPPTTCALSGGEDYELLFTISPNDFQKVDQLPNVTVIGEITDKSEGCKLLTPDNKLYDLIAQGWNALLNKE